MALRYVVSPAAKREIAEAFDWYSAKNNSAGKSFRSEVLAAFELISNDPEKWPLWDDRVRRYILKQYPYTVYFVAASGEVRILAVGHHRRQANYWEKA